jgi:hypothetical protein
MDDEFKPIPVDQVIANIDRVVAERYSAVAS